MEIFGEKSGLSPSAHKALERIFRRRVPPDTIATPELVRSLAEASRESGRQVGALIHRTGEVEHVMVGTPSGIMLPEIGRLRAAKGRFRALRLVHTHLFNEPLNEDDFTDLTRLRLDMVAAVLLSPEGEPRSFTWAYNVPKGRPGSEQSQLGYEVVDPIPWGRPQPNFGELISALESEFTRLEKHRTVEAKDGRAMLIHVGEKKPGAMKIAKARMAELLALAETAGVEVVEQIIQLRDRVDPKYVLGKGKLEAVLIKAIDLDVQTMIFDCNLNPTQAGTIASRTDLRVLDRAQLILDIFAQRAESADGKLQVELAQLKYTLPRLGQKDDSLSRLTGGIGGRGPGETKIEIGRRRAHERIHRLERQLKEQAKQRSERRRRRNSDDVPVIAIVGYTNAGKSTLMNTLTNAGVVAENKLFATLDTRSRRLYLPLGNTVILSDTVGFIRDMPRDLFSAFRATFEEAADANLLLELVDASDEEESSHRKETDKLIEELDLGHVPRLRVYNKADRLEPEALEALGYEADSLVISALEPDSVKPLLEELQRRFLPPISA
jgi:GTP-binding protein HflX